MLSAEAERSAAGKRHGGSERSDLVPAMVFRPRFPLKVTRKSATPGRPTEKVLAVPIRPGFKAGTRITFSGEGDEYRVGGTGTSLRE